MLKPLSVDRFERPVSELAAGPAPQLQWIDVKYLVVDGSYQREIGKRGAANVRQIAEHFDWAKFAPVIVAPVEGGLFAIVDGQHRTSAAILRGIEQVPCQVVLADRAKQAEAFAAVNGNVTKTTLVQLHYAKLAAGDPKATELRDVCAVAEVSFPRRNHSRDTIKVGHSQAITTIARCLDTYGRDTLITALQCITQTGDGNPGFVRASIVEALCRLLSEEPRWREGGEALLRAMDDFSYADAWDETQAGRSFVMSDASVSGFAELVRAHLTRKEEAARAKQAPAAPKGKKVARQQQAAA